MSVDVSPRERLIAQEQARTILFSDVIASTHTIEKCGDETWRQLIDHHTRIAGELAAGHDGNIVNFTGDGVMAAFATPADGVACALRLRLAFKIQAQLDVRLGVHHGPITQTANGYVGLTAHIAARLTDLAGAGEVAMSESCYQRARVLLALPVLTARQVAIRGMTNPLAVCTISDEVTAWA